jgi:hypothetical protein
MRHLKNSSLVAFLLSAIALNATPTNNWITWTDHSDYSRTTDSPYGTITYATTAHGYINIPSVLGGGTINVTLTGEITDYSQFRFAGDSTDTWNYPSTFLSSSVTSLAPAGEFVALTGYSNLTNKLTFSAPVTNLIMNIGSLGGARDAAYQFDQNFIILSRGETGWGGPTITLYHLDPKTVYGQEAAGTIQFTGTYSSLSWTTPRKELYSAYTIGVSSTAGTEVANATWTGAQPDFATSNVPEPSTYGLIGVGALGLAVIARRRKSKTA